jgi:hypothetical protein
VDRTFLGKFPMLRYNGQQLFLPRTVTQVWSIPRRIGIIVAPSGKVS